VSTNHLSCRNMDTMTVCEIMEHHLIMPAYVIRDHSCGAGRRVCNEFRIRNGGSQAQFLKTIREIHGRFFEVNTYTPSDIEWIVPLVKQYVESQ
jgi:hypothetical protein